MSSNNLTIDPIDTPRGNESVGDANDNFVSICEDSKTTPSNNLDDNENESLNNINMIESSKSFGSAEKRKHVTDEDTIMPKKPFPQIDEKKNCSLRKNIRDVMDENQLDTTTIAAQREESERLARVAEQQKIIREYQRQTSVNRQFARTQNRVLSLLQSENTFAKVTEVSTHDSSLPDAEDNNLHLNISEQCAIPKTEVTNKDCAEMTVLTSQKEDTSVIDQKSSVEVVTIDDSSSEDDCILLSDDEDENDLEEETEDDPHNSGLHVKDAYNIPDEQGRVVVNIGHPEGDEDIYVAPQIAKTIKPHQIGGVRFLYDNIIESTKRFKTSSGFGCILAHSMGLGKTLQVVCFCDIFLRHTQSKTVLCVMPINTLQNWVSEFNMWTPRTSPNPSEVKPRQFDVFVLNDQQKTLSARAKVIFKWADEGGVLLIGYELFRLLALKLISTRKRRSNKNIVASSLDSNHSKDLLERIHQALVKPGPDLVICDEGHRIKNANAGISTALKQIRTRRRVVLTGYPLQNNLLEYWCMVDFVRPNYLGTRTEFCNMFERPIQNGQCSDSTPEDIKLMRYRAHVLHSLLVGFVQRRSHVVLQQTLPQKIEFVILTRMTSFQRKLYDTFMNDVVRSKAAPNPLKAFAVCCKIWNHPDVLYSFLKRRETDLDLEIYDADISNEGQKNKIPDMTITKESKETGHIQASTSDSNQLGTEVTSLNSYSEKPRKFLDNCKPIEKDLSTTSLTEQNFNKNVSDYLSANYQRDDALYPSDCNGNNYWQDTSFSYFNYVQIGNNIESSSTPNFIGMLSEKHLEHDLDNTKESKSSEIVDLDTKEITTVATNMDLDRRSISQKNTNILGNNASQLPEMENAKSALDQARDEKQNEKDLTKGKGEDGIPYEWAVELMKGYEPGIIQNSPKMEIFFYILQESLKLRDRVLLFSQSLLTLNLIEKFLQSSLIPDTQERWTRGISYFRLDGSTTSQEREKLVNEFNSNPNIRLFLISTRAGSLGINLVGANRVVIFDASWNPCHDTQAVYRIYRYGQQKQCFVYRIVMDKCLEKKIYDRQIKKQGMSDRIVDECNPEAHLTLKDVTNLCHDYDNDEDSKKDEPIVETCETFSDIVMDKILKKHKDHLSKQPFLHESLLVDRKEKKLSQAEKRQAHKGYEMEKKATIKQSFNYSNKLQYRVVRSDGTVFNRPVASIRPMQASRPNNLTKSNGGGARSARWIPAEVWQRQGMTAQEMTLPLDVVIPTNSSDKSNIVLKAGQRVMVLKSSKGIYMQLDSGKIIAIKTQNKTSEPEKAQKPEIIDITTEADTVNDTTQNEEKGSMKNASPESMAEKEMDNDANTSNKNRMEFKTSMEKSNSVSNSFTKNSLCKTHKETISSESSIPAYMPTISSMTYSTQHNNLGSSFFKAHCNNSSLESVKKHIHTEFKSSNSSEKTESTNIKNLKNNKDLNKHNQDFKSENFVKSLPTTSAPISEVKGPESKTIEITEKKGHSNIVSGNDAYRQHRSDEAHINLSTQQLPFPAQKDNNGHLLYGFNPQTQQRTNYIDHTSHHSLKSVNSTSRHLHTENNKDDSSQEKPNNLVQYNTQPLNYNNNETSVSYLSPSLSVTEHTQSSPNVHYPSREIYNNSHSQYYGNVYDPNTIGNPTSYSPQFGNYSAYNSYSHPHFRPPFHGNVQNASTSTSIGSNPYMAWPFMPSSAINEPCNAVYSTSYTQNSSHQYNQWHNQR